MKLGAVVRRDQPRPIHLDPSIRTDDYPAVMVGPGALKALYRHAAKGFPNEIGGYAVGLPLADPETGARATYIERVIPAASISTHTHVTFLPESMAEVDRICRDADLLLVGYYHSHPGFSVFQSGEDVDTFRRYYAEPYQIAIVVDPTRTKPDRLAIGNDWIGFFGWSDDHRPRLIPASHLELVRGRPTREAQDNADTPRRARIRRNPRRIFRRRRQRVPPFAASLIRER